MRVGAYIEQLDQHLWLTRILTITVLVLAVLVLVLTRQSIIIHVAPPEFRTAYDVGPSTASRSYVEQMSSFLVVNALTVNPESAEFSARSFLKFLTPEARGKLQSAVLGDAEWVKNNNISQAFYSRTIDHYGNNKLRITGTLVQWMAGRLVTNRDVAIDLQIQINNYALQIKDFAYVSEENLRRPSSAPAPAAGQ